MRNKNKGFKIVATGTAEILFSCEVNLSKFKAQSQVEHALDTTDLHKTMVQKIMNDGKYQIVKSELIRAEQCECCAEKEQKIPNSELTFNPKFMQEGTRASAIKTGGHFLWDSKKERFVDVLTGL